MEKYSNILFVMTNENQFNNTIDNALESLSMNKDKCIYNKEDKSFFISNKYFSVKLKLILLNTEELFEYIKNNYEYEGMILICDCITANNIVVRILNL